MLPSNSAYRRFQRDWVAPSAAAIGKTRGRSIAQKTTPNGVDSKHSAFSSAPAVGDEKDGVIASSTNAIARKPITASTVIRSMRAVATADVDHNPSATMTTTKSTKLPALIPEGGSRLRAFSLGLKRRSRIACHH